jgi:hypothetical protein
MRGQTEKKLVRGRKSDRAQHRDEVGVRIDDGAACGEDLLGDGPLLRSEANVGDGAVQRGKRRARTMCHGEGLEIDE